MQKLSGIWNARGAWLTAGHAWLFIRRDHILSSLRCKPYSSCLLARTEIIARAFFILNVRSVNSSPHSQTIASSVISGRREGAKIVG
jgi:hypothetical protein